MSFGENIYIDRNRSYQELFYFIVKNKKNTSYLVYIVRDNTYGYHPLKIGDTFDTVMGMALDFYSDNLPSELFFNICPDPKKINFFSKNEELWWELEGQTGVALNEWQLKILKAIEKKEEDKGVKYGA